MDSPDELDKLILELPIMKGMGNQVQMKVSSVRSYESFAADLAAMLEKK